MTSSFDDVDLGLLESVRDLYDAVDPMPPDLVVLTQFAIEIEGPGLDVARFSAETVAGGARGAEQSRLITFDSTSGTIAVQITVREDEDLRLDGWLTSPGEHRVELRTATGTIEAELLPHGRFVCPCVPAGLVQIVVRLPGTTIATPMFVL